MRLRVFFVIYAAANLGLVVYGVLALFNPGILLESFSSRVYQFPKDAAVAVDYLSAFFRLLGFFNIIPGILGLVLLRQYRINRQTWILRIVIAASLLSYLGPIVFDNTVGHIGTYEVVEHILFIGMILSGIFMLSDLKRARP